MPKIHTLTNPAKPGDMMGAESKRLLRLINDYPNQTTEQLAKLWPTLPPLAHTTGPTANTSPRDTQTWMSLRVSRLKGLGHVLNNGMRGSGCGLWHITPKGLRAIGLISTNDTTTPPGIKPPTQQQIYNMLARRVSKLHLANTPQAEPSATQAAARATAAPQQPAPSQPAEAPAKAKAADTPKPAAIDPAKLSPREREIAMFADFHSIVSGKPVPYNGIKSQLGSKGKASLYGPNSTVR